MAGKYAFGSCDQPAPGLPAVPLPCAGVAARQPVLTRLSLSLFQLSRHNKSLQQLLKPVKRIQEEEEEGISSMVRRGLGNGGRAPATHPNPDQSLQRAASPTLAEPPWALLFKISWVLIFPRGTEERKTYQCPCSPNDKPKGMCILYNQAAVSCICQAPQARLSRRVMSSLLQGQAGGPDGALLSHLPFRKGRAESFAVISCLCTLDPK